MASSPITEHTSATADPAQREQVFDIFRRWGYLQSALDPLGQYLPPEPFPVATPEGELAQEARGYYCGSIGVEFMHIASPTQRQWLQHQMEQPAPAVDQKRILTGPIRAGGDHHLTRLQHLPIVQPQRERVRGAREGQHGLALQRGH